jgi:GAF domain-containing protein
MRLCRAVVARSKSPTWRGWAHSVCVVACTHIPSVGGAAITVQGGVITPELMAANDVWAARMEELQQLVGEGPSITAGQTGTMVVASDVDTEHQRWPGYAGAVAGSGVRGVWAFPLLVHDICVGSLTLYHLHRPPSRGRAWEDGEALADIAAAAVLADLGAGHTDSSPRLERYAVHIAVGLLSARLQISTEDALARIRAHAFSNGATLADVAAGVVSGELELT